MVSRTSTPQDDDDDDHRGCARTTTLHICPRGVRTCLLAADTLLRTHARQALPVAAAGISARTTLRSIHRGVRTCLLAADTLLRTHARPALPVAAAGVETTPLPDRVSDSVG